MCVLSKFKYIQIVLIADTYCLFCNSAGGDEGITDTFYDGSGGHGLRDDLSLYRGILHLFQVLLKVFKFAVDIQISSLCCFSLLHCLLKH